MPVLPNSWSGSLVPSRNRFLSTIAATFGFDVGLDPDLAQRALEWLDETISELNTNTWECTRVAESGIVFVEGQQWVILNSQFFKSSQAYLVNNSDGDRQPLKNLPWIQFKRMYPGTTGDGCPSIYSLFNAERDARIYFDVLPNEDTRNNYTLAVEYYSRLPKFSSVGPNNTPDIPAEFETVILNGALRRGALHFGNAAQAASYSGLEAMALERVKRIDSYQPDADRRFKLIDEISYPFNIDQGVNPF